MTDTAISALVMLFVTVAPFEVASMFFVLAANASPEQRRQLALRACMTGFLVLVAFALGGNRLLGALQVGLPAFRAAGGVLLLGLARDLLFAKPSGLSSITPGEEAEATGQADIAVFPLAIPLIAGPGSMTAIVLLTGQADNAGQMVVVLLALLAIMALTFGAMLAAERLFRLLGRTGVNVIARVSGILLAALAMQFLFDGLRQSGLLH
ncbi:MarC family protein [Roseomonas sp. E05]|uniref:MarC family protein n=1 Tax=Roseomonas sp. E05 TaxID=3046310 RepID=UPI0024BB32EB|nr:MarC family protein [Roseomonas sp. E05]MDJ0390928.1 MarC family protein [Roseomonas sp. E05]